MGVLLLLVSVNIGLPGQELLQTLRFHLVIAFLLLPVALLITGARLRSMAVLALLLLSAGQGGAIILDQLQRRAPLEARPVAASLSLVSFNVLATNPDGHRIAAYLAEAKPDLAVIMEAPGIAPYLAELQATFPTRIGCQTKTNCDIALLSRLPLDNQQIRTFGPFRRERLIVATTQIAGQQVTIIAAHLSKPYFDDFGWIELTEIRALLRSITGPVILAGDFNSAPWSHSVARFASQMNLAPPPSYPATWPVQLGGFGVPIDNMFSRDGALIRTIATLSDALGSNHLGLVARVDILQPSAR